MTTNARQPDHYIIRARSASGGDAAALLAEIIRSCGYRVTGATIDFKVDTDADKTYMVAKLCDYERCSGHKVDDDQTRLHDFSGRVDGLLLAVFHR